VHDPNFFIKASFPSEGSKVICENLVIATVTQLESLQHRVLKETEYSRYSSVNCYIMCETSNNSAIDSASSRAHQYQADLNTLEALLQTSQFSQLQQLVKSILGEQTSSGSLKDSALSSPACKQIEKIDDSAKGLPRIYNSEGFDRCADMASQ
jgi:hypothetical protein